MLNLAAKDFKKPGRLDRQQKLILDAIATSPEPLSLPQVLLMFGEAAAVSVRKLVCRGIVSRDRNGRYSIVECGND